MGLKGAGWAFMMACILVSSGLFISRVRAEKPAHPVRIGVLTESWGPTPPIVATLIARTFLLVPGAYNVK